MDPISAAGLGLGITSLAFQLLGGCIKGYEIFLNMVEMPAEFEHLRLRLRLEQSRLLNWGEKVGLLEEALERPSIALQLHRNLITDILLDIQRMFKDCLTIETQFDRIGHFNDDEPIARTGPVIIQPPDRNRLLTKALKAWEKTAQVPARVKWAFVKQDKFEQLVEKLISYNDAMVSLLDRTTIRQLHDMQLQSQLVLLQLSSKVDDLRRLAQAIQIQTQDRTQTFPNIRLSDTSGLPGDESTENASFARLANFKAEQIIVERGSSSVTNSAIERELISLTEGSSVRPLATYGGESVWVEWKSYDADHQFSSWPQMVEERIQKLAILLGMNNTPEQFRAPHCLGYFKDYDDDEPRFGLIYRRPGGSSNTEPVALIDLFREATKPSLTHRVKLAHTIASSIMYLHSVNWLHKGIRSENIIFFTSRTRVADSVAPIISGFEYARPDLPEEFTEKPAEDLEHDFYRHPDALIQSGSRSKKSWDIYSLGVVLIEIALWEPIEDILDLMSGQTAVPSKLSRSKLRKIRSLLLEDDFLDKIASEVGDRYKNVVRRCITGGLGLGIRDGADEADPAIGADMLQAFSQDVVEQLKGIGV